MKWIDAKWVDARTISAGRISSKLKRMYDTYNRKWFGNRLPRKAIVRWSNKLKRHGAIGWCAPTECPDSPLIEISTEIKRLNSVVRTVMLHEMVHVYFINRKNSGSAHGKQFQNKIKSLVVAGAYNDLL